MGTIQKLGRMPIGLTVPAFAIQPIGIPIVLLFLTSLNAPALLANCEAFLGQRMMSVLFQTIEVSWWPRQSASS
ncbi:hypothetical protein ACVIHH_008455 [Bradyrhizobium sp. USDA 4518]